MLPLGPIDWWQCARLNRRVARLALAGRWLASPTVAASYDRLASQYDDAWQRHVRPVTQELLDRLPDPPRGRILELGCGTGCATGGLSARYASWPLIALDISAAMLAEARQRVPRGDIQWVQAEMLEFLSAQPDQSASMIFSAWAMGYSRPARVMREAARILLPGGVLAFVVNYADTLRPVFQAFRECMARFPEQVQLAARLHFPTAWLALQRIIERCGLRIQWHQDGFREIPRPAGRATLPWLLQTGVLAGFDAMLPLASGGAVAEHFERLLQRDPDPLRHHYASVLARRSHEKGDL